MGKTEIWSFSTTLQPDISQGRAVILHILQAMLRRKIVKMVNLGRKIEMTRSETKRNSDHA